MSVGRALERQGATQAANQPPQENSHILGVRLEFPGGPVQPRNEESQRRRRLEKNQWKDSRHDAEDGQ